MSNIITVNFNAIGNVPTAEDLEKTYPEPRSDRFFEFEVESAELRPSKSENALQLALKVAALDSEANAIFTKFVNVSLPIAYNGHPANDYAGSIWNSSISALFPEILPYNHVEKDPSNDKKSIYTKDGQPVDGAAMKAVEKTKAANAAEILKGLISSSESSLATLHKLVGRHFFAKVQPDKTGKYVNVRPMMAMVPADETVCYNKKEAYNK